MRATPLVSIIMPCRNVASTLAEAIESVRAQTYPNWELILFDDGSTDSTADITAVFAASDPRIRPIRSPHVGIVEALRRACEGAQGDLLARMDGDDIALPERIAAQVRVMAEAPEITLCGCGVEVFGDEVRQGRRRYEGWLNSLHTHEDIVRELFIECPLAHPTFLIRREPFDQIGGYIDRGWPEDYDVILRLFLAGGRFAKVPQPLLRWRESPGRLSLRDGRYSPEQFRALKRAYLFRSYLAGNRPFIQWGAGEVGKPWLREWAGRTPLAVVDINQRKIGCRIHGYAVIPPEDLPAPGRAFVVVGVGTPGARDEIRAWLCEHGYTELRDFLFLA